MRARWVALLALAAAAVAGIVYWRRSRRTVEPAVQLGLADGSVHPLDPTDPATAELQDLAARVHGSFTGGA